MAVQKTYHTHMQIPSARLRQVLRHCRRSHDGGCSLGLCVPLVPEPSLPTMTVRSTGSAKAPEAPPRAGRSTLLAASSPGFSAVLPALPLHRATLKQSRKGAGAVAAQQWQLFAPEEALRLRQRVPLGVALAASLRRSALQPSSAPQQRSALQQQRSALH